MKHASQMHFEAANRAVPDVIDDSPDKWVLLQLVTDAAEVFDLSHRTISVLKALLTFLPTRHIPNGPRAVVFPANRTLSHRLSGMPESTLRRHLAQLVRAGIVSRQDSPNRKRFARHRAGQVAIAYGFDLSPLTQMASTLAQHATAAQDRRAALAVLRSQVMDVRALVLRSGIDNELTDDAARLLRRKPDQQALKEMLGLLTSTLEAMPAKEMSANDDENERHIQVNSEYISKPLSSNTPLDEEISLSQVTQHCTAFVELFPEKVRDWHDLLRITHQVAPMLGLSQQTLDNAGQIMGRRGLCLVILCMLERFTNIENPTAYLKSLILSVRRGVFRPISLLKGSVHPNCQLTI